MQQDWHVPVKVLSHADSERPPRRRRPSSLRSAGNRGTGTCLIGGHTLELMATSSQPEPWMTIAPVCDLWELPEKLDLPFHFNKRNSLRPVPEWLLSVLDNTGDSLKPRLRQVVVERNVRYCIAGYCQVIEFGDRKVRMSGVFRPPIRLRVDVCSHIVGASIPHPVQLVHPSVIT